MEAEGRRGHEEEGNCTLEGSPHKGLAADWPFTLRPAGSSLYAGPFYQRRAPARTDCGCAPSGAVYLLEEWEDLCLLAYGAARPAPAR